MTDRLTAAQEAHRAALGVNRHRIHAMLKAAGTK